MIGEVRGPVPQHSEKATTGEVSQSELRVRHGRQCPECYGVRVEARTTRFDPQPVGFLCVECGCQFGSRS
jgi:hypothetical protein